jgi:hypothetical protein
VRDALRDMKIIDGDAPSNGHVFLYRQVVDKAKDGKRGVEITVAEA